MYDRKHAFPTGRRDLLDHLGQDGLSTLERRQTLMSLTEAYEADILRFGRRRQWGNALFLLHEMDTIGAKRTASTFAAAAQACSDKVKQWNYALDVFEHFKSSGVRETVEPYNWVITACKKARRWTPAMGVFDEMRKAEVTPDETTFRSMLSVCKGGAQWELGLSLIYDMEDAGVEPREAEWNSVMDACEAAGDLDMYDVIEDEAAARGFEIQI